jgi:hypothetical protein
MDGIRGTSSPSGVKATDAELAALPPRRHDFHDDWSYILTAQSNRR